MCLGVGDCQGEPRRFIACAMDDAEKKARLAQALRDNLRKRKAQAREQASEEGQSESTHRLTRSPSK